MTILNKTTFNFTTVTPLKIRENKIPHPPQNQAKAYLGFLDWEKEDEKGGEKERSDFPREVRQGAE